MADTFDILQKNEDKQQSKTEKIERILLNYENDFLDADQTTPVIQNGICLDGIIDEGTFDQQRKRVVFLLKETNGNNRSGQLPAYLPKWDYRKWLNEQQFHNIPDGHDGEKFYGRTFYNLCMWQDLLYRCLDNEPVLPFKEYCTEYFNENMYRSLLGKTAIVNLKKTWGTGSTKWSDLNNYLSNENVRHALRIEMDVINPDIVICGGREVFDFAVDIFRTDVNRSDDKKKIMLPGVNDTASCVLIGDIPYVEFYHPACRKKREWLYEYAISYFDQIKTWIS